MFNVFFFHTISPKACQPRWKFHFAGHPSYRGPASIILPIHPLFLKIDIGFYLCLWYFERELNRAFFKWLQCFLSFELMACYFWNIILKWKYGLLSFHLVLFIWELPSHLLWVSHHLLYLFCWPKGCAHFPPLPHQWEPHLFYLRCI